VHRSDHVLRLYTQPSDRPPLDWSWVEQQLRDAGTFWVTPGGAVPHPRPVWGVWTDGLLHLSVGSPGIRRQLTPGAPCTVHLDSGTDVVIVEGRCTGTTTDAESIGRYDRKYDWTYDADRYGPLTTVAALDVLAWRSAGPAGRDGFEATGRWRFGADRAAPPSA
jgi:hypothetical protein